MLKERVVMLEQDLGIRMNRILAIQRFQTYKEFPRDLHLREHILAIRMMESSYHQIWDGERSWMNYTL